MTGSTHANIRSAHSPGLKPEGSARDNPITTLSEPSVLASVGASGKHKEPGSLPASTCPAQPPSKAGGDSPRGGGRHHGDRKADRSNESDWTGRGAAHQRGTRTDAKPQRPAGAANPGSAHNTQQTAAQEKVPRTAGPPRPHTARTASGKRALAARLERRELGPGTVRVFGRPTPRQEGPPADALAPPPRRAKPARKSARCGVGDGSPRPQPPHPQPVGSGPLPHAQMDERSGVGERPTPDAPHPSKRHPPGAPSCCPHSAQSQLVRACAVVLVTGPHARTPRTHIQWVVGPGRTPEQTRGRGQESA